MCTHTDIPELVVDLLEPYEVTDVVPLGCGYDEFILREMSAESLLATTPSVRR
jgi:hypothetical protein